MATPTPAATTVLLMAALMLVAPAVLVRGQHMQCSDVYSALMPCLSYVQYGGSEVPDTCCSGIKQLLGQAATTADRRTSCSCLKDLATGVPSGPYVGRAASLPQMCHVTNFPYKISANMNCKTIK